MLATALDPPASLVDALRVLAAILSIAFSALALRRPRPRVARATIAAALGAAIAIALRAIDPLLPVIATVALAVPVGAMLALLPALERD